MQFTCAEMLLPNIGTINITVFFVTMKVPWHSKKMLSLVLLMITICDNYISV